MVYIGFFDHQHFNPRTPEWDATLLYLISIDINVNFNPRTPEWDATLAAFLASAIFIISIHAPLSGMRPSTTAF